jgi:hypothetical protein
VKILIDENLPPRLSARLADLFPEMHHVRDLTRKASQTPRSGTSPTRKGTPRIVRIDRCDFPHGK